MFAFRVNDRHRNGAQQSKRDQPRLFVFESVVDKRKGQAFEHAKRIREVQAMRFEIELALGIGPSKL